MPIINRNDQLGKKKKIEINKKGSVRTARIFYFRELTGKKAKIKDKRR